MNSNDSIKELVKKKYGEIAKLSTGCCGSGSGAAGSSGNGISCGTQGDVVSFADPYDKLAGYVPDADLGLGCGLPTETAGIKTGDVVLDLGSGAGNDIFVARSETGPEGELIGLDMAPEMVEKARENASRQGFDNVEFILGEIEDMPLPDDKVDVVVSNCVLNLVPNKATAFAEIHRVLKPGGHFSISDIVLEGELPESLKEAAIVYVGCVAGAQQKDEYLETISASGFTGVKVLKTREINLPDSLLDEILGEKEAAEFRESGVKVLSVTVYGEK